MDFSKGHRSKVVCVCTKVTEYFLCRMAVGGLSELMTELSRECAETSYIFFLRGCCDLNAGVFACGGILSWHEELLTLLFLT